MISTRWVPTEYLLLPKQIEYKCRVIFLSYQHFILSKSKHERMYSPNTNSFGSDWCQQGEYLLNINLFVCVMNINWEWVNISYPFFSGNQSKHEHIYLPIIYTFGSHSCLQGEYLLNIHLPLGVLIINVHLSFMSYSLCFQWQSIETWTYVRTDNLHFWFRFMSTRWVPTEYSFTPRRIEYQWRLK